MTKNSQDELARACAMLKALRKNIDQIGAIPENYINEYHSILDKLEDSTGINLLEFRVPDAEITHIPPFSAVTVIPGEPIPKGPYSKEKYVKKQYFLMKIDAILGYFEIITAPEQKKMGYNTHKD